MFFVMYMVVQSLYTLFVILAVIGIYLLFQNNKETVNEIKDDICKYVNLKRLIDEKNKRKY